MSLFQSISSKYYCKNGLDSWEQVFQSILQLLDEYELHRHTLNAAVRENTSFLTRMENVVVVLQQVLSVPAIRSLECNAFLEELLRNMRHFRGGSRLLQL